MRIWILICWLGSMMAGLGNLGRDTVELSYSPTPASCELGELNASNGSVIKYSTTD